MSFVFSVVVVVDVGVWRARVRVCVFSSFALLFYCFCVYALNFENMCS